MIKKFLLLVLLSLFTNMFSQTNEETKIWIKSKLETYLYNSLNKNSVDKVELDDCHCTIYYTSSTNMGELKNVVKFPTSVKNINEWIVPYAKNVEHIVYKEKRNKNELVNHIFNKENTFPLYIREGEENLSFRLLKAFKHLNTFCIKSGKETF